MTLTFEEEFQNPLPFVFVVVVGYLDLVWRTMVHSYQNLCGTVSFIYFILDMDFSDSLHFKKYKILVFENLFMIFFIIHQVEIS